jgi:polysaccharide export outer membrane protein
MAGLLCAGCQLENFLVSPNGGGPPPAGAAAPPPDPGPPPQPADAGPDLPNHEPAWNPARFVDWLRRWRGNEQPAVTEPLFTPAVPELPPPSIPGLPRELSKVSLPPYILEPPDVVIIDAVRLTPRPPYRLEPLDVVQIQVANALPDQPLSGTYTVGLEGNVNFGSFYGITRVAGLTVEQAQAMIRRRLAEKLKNPQVTVQLMQCRGLQQVRGEHLVRPDGSIGLGSYGDVYVTGMTLLQAKWAIENHLAPFLVKPDISLDVRAYNSKVYYVVTDCAGGEQVYIFPITGNETVLDAIGRIAGLPAAASRGRIWVARPASCGADRFQILPVDWCAIVRGGATRTNYQLFPGDRVYVEANCWARVDHAVARAVAPLKSLFAIPLLETVTVRRENAVMP